MLITILRFCGKKRTTRKVKKDTLEVVHELRWQRNFAGGVMVAGKAHLPTVWVVTLTQTTHCWKTWRKHAHTSCKTKHSCTAWGSYFLVIKTKVHKKLQQ